MKTILIFLSLLFTGLIQAKGHIAEGGSNIGGGNIGSEYITTWCKNQSSLLRNYQDRAQLKVNHTGDYNLANKILSDGMAQALLALKENNNSFLFRNLVRGLDIARNLEATSGKNAERKAMVINNILSSYYNFMLNTVVLNLDLGAYLEQNLVLYVSSQLDWIIENLTREISIGEKVVIVPVGDAKTLIKVAIIITKGAAEDLDDSLWNRRFSCAISDLEILNNTIISYDQGNREMFDNEKVAVGYLGKELKRISHRVGLNSNCN